MVYLSPGELEKAALLDKWDLVDKSLRSIASDQSQIYVDAALRQLESRRINIRDLGASVIESQKKLPQGYGIKVKSALLDSLARNGTRNYAGFRSACALAVHQPGRYRSDVEPVLRHFTSDNEEAVRRIAKKYIRLYLN